MGSVADLVKKDQTTLRDSKTKEKTRKGHCFQFLRWLFCVYNLSLLLCGSAILGVGTWTLSEKWYYIYLIEDTTYKSTILLLMLTGLVAVLTGVLGYTAILTSSKPLLAVYTILIVIVFVFEAFLGLISYVLQDRLKEDLGRCIEANIFDKYQEDPLVTASFDKVQIEFGCCGVESYQDWTTSGWTQTVEGLKVPDSCCKTPSAGCGVRDHPSNIAHTGCVHRLERELYGLLDWVKVTSLGLGLLQVWGVLLTSGLITARPRLTRHKTRPVMVSGYWRTN